MRLIISRKIPSDNWELDPILEALRTEIQAREKAGVSQPNNHHHNRHRREQPTGAALITNTEVVTCCYCQGNHDPTSCTVVIEPELRQQTLRRQGRCFNCLKKNHVSKECRTPAKCSVCKKKHHPSVCKKTREQPSVNLQAHESPLDPNVSSFEPNSSALCTRTGHTVLLQLASGTIFNLRTPSKREKARIIFDSGSQRSYVTERLKNKLDIQAEGQREMSILTFGSARERRQACNIVSLGVHTMDGTPLVLKALTVPLICNAISAAPVRACQDYYAHLKGLELVDSFEEGEADVLIGSDHYWYPVRGKEREPVAMNTKLGWILSGPAPSLDENPSTSLITHVLRVDCNPTSRQLDNTLKSFWDLESLGITDSEVSVYEQFSSNVVFKEGRYEVSLPWRDPCSSLPDNLRLSQKRMFNLWRRLKRDPDILQQYNSVIEQQKDLGIVEVVSSPEMTTPNRVHYLPHHAVLRKDKSTTKLRVVYDASAKDQGPSLNDSLYVGPKFHQLIFEILLRFRLHKIGLIADVEKAFLMISVSKPDRDVLRFLWPKNIEEDTPTLETLRFTRVVFGVSCSPFLLNATIRHHLNVNSNDYPEVVDKLNHSFYVDDVVTGAPDLKSAFEFYSTSKTVMRKGGFNLCKFVTNCTDLQARINIAEGDNKGQVNETYAKSTLNQCHYTTERQKKVLGILWNTEGDELIYNFDHLNKIICVAEPTKRQIVSLAGRFYDPLGLIQPIIVTFKIFIQELCRVGVPWDEPINGELLQKWQSLTKDLCDSPQFTIPRYYANTLDKVDSYQLYGFCDASKAAYAAVVYLSVRRGTENSVKVVASKSRVSPLKAQTIPRLELMGALLLARLIVSVYNSLSLEINLEPSECFTDSLITLYWIKGTDKDWKPFVHNRVKEIRKLAPADHWSHCTGKENPADAPSRGLTPSELLHHKLWWNGPEWLGTVRTNCSDLAELPEDYDIELKSKVMISMISDDNKISNILNINNYSTFDKLLRITAMLISFGLKIRKKRNDYKMAVAEAKQLWLLDVQKQLIQKDFKVLQQQLDLFNDEKGIWRSKGRIGKSQLPYSTRHPIVLPRDHHFTVLLVKRAHYRVGHGGVKETLTEIRSEYWIVKARSFIKRIIHLCVVCRRYGGLPYRAPPPPPLPSFRVTEQPPFTYTGVDYAGPLSVKPDYPLHAPCEQKVWLCVYTCCVTRAAHIDIVVNLSCCSFLRSFKRFTSRRGFPQKMISDNGSTFKSAGDVLQRIVADPAVARHLAGLNVEWIYNLEKAPWWGGLFERIIGLTKRCLRKIVGRAKFTYDELLTAVTEIESILNSRPISVVSSVDLEEPLTPFHLLNGRRLSNLPDELCFRQVEEEYTFNTLPILLNKRLRYLQSTLDKYWERWRNEYLTNLRERYYKDKQSPRARTVRVGDIVIVQTEREARGFWRLGRITNLITGTDGQVRGAVVYTVSANNRPSFLRRPVQKLYPLEIDSTTDVQAHTDINSTSTDSTLARSTDHITKSAETTTSHTLTDNHVDQETQSRPSNLRSVRPSRSAAQQARDKIYARICENSI